MLDTESKLQGNWGLPEPFELPRLGRRYITMPNNSVLAIKQEDANGTWDIYSSTLPNFLHEGKNQFYLT